MTRSGAGCGFGIASAAADPGFGETASGICAKRERSRGSLSLLAAPAELASTSISPEASSPKVSASPSANLLENDETSSSEGEPYRSESLSSLISIFFEAACALKDHSESSVSLSSSLRTPLATASAAFPQGVPPSSTSSSAGVSSPSSSPGSSSSRSSSKDAPSSSPSSSPSPSPSPPEKEEGEGDEGCLVALAATTEAVEVDERGRRSCRRSSGDGGGAVRVCIEGSCCLLGGGSNATTLDAKLLRRSLLVAAALRRTRARRASSIAGDESCFY